MKPYSVKLPDGSKAHVINKIMGRRRSIRLLFFKIKRKKTLIAYSVRLISQENIGYTIYKVKRSGVWTRGGERESGRFDKSDKKRTLEIKSAIDSFETAYYPWAYKELF